MAVLVQLLQILAFLNILSNFIVLSRNYSFCKENEFHLAKSGKCLVFINESATYNFAEVNCSLRNSVVLHIPGLDTSEVGHLSNITQGNFSTWTRSVSMNNSYMAVEYTVSEMSITYSNVSIGTIRTFFCERPSLASSLYKTNYDNINLNASSTFTYPTIIPVIKFLPEYSRLDTSLHRGSFYGKGWCSNSSKLSEYLEVDARGLFIFTGVQIQHGAVMNCLYNVETFTMEILGTNSLWERLPRKNNYSGFNFQNNNETITWLENPIVVEKIRIFPKTFSSSCNQYEEIFCMRLDVFGQYVKQDFREIEVSDSTDSLDSGSSLWPDGNYGIPMFKPTCNVNIAKGFILHKAKLKESNISGNIRFSDNTTFYQDICLHTNSSVNNYDFQQGEYCIYKTTTGCPIGFSVSDINNTSMEFFDKGTVTLADEDFSPLNLSIKTIDYCCRSDNISNIISNETFQFLEPFYLIPKTNSCDIFQGYFSTIETYTIEGEDFPSNVSANFPYFETRSNNVTNLTTYFYCLYQPRNPIDRLTIYPTHPLVVTNDFEFIVYAYSLEKIAAYSIDSDSDIEINLVNLTCTNIPNTVTLKNGFAVIRGELCQGINSSMITVKLNTTRGEVLTNEIKVVFSLQMNTLILLDENYMDIINQNDLLFNQSTLNFENLTMNSYDSIFTESLNFQYNANYENKIDNLIVLNPKTKLNEILSLTQVYDIPAFVYDVDEVDNYYVTDQTRYASAELTNYLPFILTNEKITKSNGIVIYRAANILTLFEFYAIFKTRNILYKDIILPHKDSISDRDIHVLSNCKRCFVFIFLDSQRSSLLLSKLTRAGYTPANGYNFVSFSSKYVIANTFIRSECMNSNPPCHVTFNNMWNIFYENNPNNCMQNSEVSSILSQPIQNLTKVIMKDLSDIVFNDVVYMIEKFINTSKKANTPINTINLLNYADSLKCTNSGSGLQFTPNALTKELLVESYSIMCQPGWSGKLCTIPFCSDTSCNTTHGKCIAPETCYCEDNWYGKDCTGDCRITCINGICNDGVFGDGKCESCDWLYLGDYCTENSIIYGFIAAGVGTSIVSLFVVCYIIKVLQTQEQTAEAITEAAEKDYTLSFDDIDVIEDVEFKNKVTFKHIFKKFNHISYRKATTFTGQEIFLKCYKKPYFTLSLGLKTELKKLCTLEHNNVVKLLGIMLDTSTVALVTNNASMGSLYDVLHEKHIPITWDVKYSILQDIARGMAYLHDIAKIEYGRLKSTNCLLHQGWLVKLTDIGLRKIKARPREQKKVINFTAAQVLESRRSKPTSKRKHSRSKSIDGDTNDETDYHSLLWTAPEFISSGAINLDEIIRFTPQADVYSYGIIMSEIVGRRPPYSEITVMNIPHIVQVIGHLKDPILNLEQMNANKTDAANQNTEKIHSDILRPVVDESLYPTDESEKTILQNLMENCWSETPDERPPFAYCLEVLELITPLKGNQTVKRSILLERETESLEQYISYDTKNIFKEKDKYNDLLARLLPLTIAQQLHEGKHIATQRYENVTVMVYRIFNFKEIMEKCDAVQSMAIVDYIHRAIDMIIQNRKFKIMEIDCSRNMHVLAAGIPEMNGNRHALEIVTLATRLNAAVKTFRLPHLPDFRIYLRIGIHTGLADAGIVYRSNTPSYIVVGEAIKYAHALEEESLPNCIHVSKKTISLLHHSDFEIVGRASYKLKIEKQFIRTYWISEK